MTKVTRSLPDRLGGRGPSVRELLETRSVPESDTGEFRSSSPNRRDLSNRPETYRTTGVVVSENTLRNWLKKGKGYLNLVVVELRRSSLEKDAVVNCYETWYKVRKYDRYKKYYMWVLVNKVERVVICFEREYDKEMITDEERIRRRQGLPTIEAMINLRANLLQELKSEEDQQSCYMQEVLNYLYKFWKEAFTYIKDGRYPISNNLAERAVRPFTTKRKNPLHLGSDEGAEIATVYHSIISTVKLQGRSAWDYLGKFFTGIFNSCRDFLSLAPQNINLAVCQ